MPDPTLYKFKTITEFHRAKGLPKPEHPLISVIDYDAMKREPAGHHITQVLDFYSIALKRNIGVKIKYGQQQYDFDEGIMFFISPGQVYRIETDFEDDQKRSGWILLIHPDFLWNTTLAKNIRQYEYFDYSVNEALFLSEKEELQVTEIIQNVRQEYHSNIDKFSQNIIIAQLELMFNYADRFYHRQLLQGRSPTTKYWNDSKRSYPPILTAVILQAVACQRFSISPTR